MKVMKKGLLGLFFAYFALAGCGGGGSSSTSPSTSTETVQTATGKFVDGPVTGLQYRSGAQSGLTGADGSFKYEVGKTVTFAIGDIVLGEVQAGPVVTPLQFAEDSDATTPKVNNMVRFLTSIGTVDANGNISIPEAVLTAAKGVTLDFATATDAELAAAVTKLKAGAALTDQGSATDHLSRCVYSEFQGAYVGGFQIYSGGSMHMTLTLNSDGTFSGLNPDNHETVNGTMKSGTIFEVVASGGCHLTGKLDPATGIISGTWILPGSTAPDGTFTLQRN